MLIVISHNDYFKNEIYYIEKILNEGADYFHLRKPALSEFEFSKLVSEIPEYLHKRISIHSHYNLLNKFNLGGIHFTSKSKHLIKEFESNKIRKSASCHSFNEIEDIPSDFDYVFLSPVFNSISKKNYNGKFSDHNIREFVSADKNKKIIALGGISDSNIKEVKNLGYSGAALMGFIWNNISNIDLINKVKNYV